MNNLELDIVWNNAFVYLLQAKKQIDFAMMEITQADVDTPYLKECKANIEKQLNDAHQEIEKLKSKNVAEEQRKQDESDESESSDINSYL